MIKKAKLMESFPLVTNTHTHTKCPKSPLIYDWFVTRKELEYHLPAVRLFAVFYEPDKTVVSMPYCSDWELAIMRSTRSQYKRMAISPIRVILYHSCYSYIYRRIKR